MDNNDQVVASGTHTSTINLQSVGAAQQNAKKSDHMELPTAVNALRAEIAASSHEASPDSHRIRARLYASLAGEYARAGLPREGIEAVKMALQLANTYDDKHIAAIALDAAAMCHYARGDCLMALSSGLDAYQHFYAVDDERSIGNVLTTIASAFKDIEVLDLAEMTLNVCVGIADRHEDHFLEARARNALGVLLGDIGRFDEALVQFTASRQRLIEMQLDAITAKVVSNIGNLQKKRAVALIKTGQPEMANTCLRDAIMFVDEGLKASTEDGNMFDIADKSSALSEYYFLLHEFPRARLYIDQALIFGNKIRHGRLIAESHFLRGKIHRAEKKFEDAEREYRIALGKAKDAEIKSIQHIIHQELADYFMETGRHSDAAAQRAVAEEAQLLMQNNRSEAQREVRAIWQRYFSQHPLFKGAAH